MSAITLREERMKEREGTRLYRSLRRLFTKPFGFEWTNGDTSYFDGKNNFVKYDMQKDIHRTFTDAEIRALRHGHGVHEAGHSEYDYLPDYIDWQIEMIAKSKQEVLDNEKYPLSWLQFFGNFGLDGRMERLIVLKVPSQQPYLDLNNYEWRFGKRLEGLGESDLNDFRHAYAHRVLGMEDVEEWSEAAVELLERVQPLIDNIRLAPTTKTSLECVTELIREVWPTILNWMDLEKKEPSDETPLTPDMTQGEWSASAEEAAQRSQSVMDTYDSDDANSDDSDDNSLREDGIKELLRQMEKSINREIQEVDEEIKDETPSNISVSFKGQFGEMSATVNESAIPNPDLDAYHETVSSIRRHIKPVAKELKALLEGVPEQTRRNVRSGRFMAGQAWRAIHCNDSQVFSKQEKAQPKADALIGCMTDISGSTSHPLPNGLLVYKEMQKGLALLLEASDLAGIPTEAFAFTEFSGTRVYRLKPTDAALNDTHRRAIGGIEPMYGNRDTVALKYLLDRIRQKTEGIRLAIMLSDGIPAFYDDEGPDTIQQMVKEAEKDGIEVLCLFIGDHDSYTVDMVKKMYPGRVIAADKGIAKELQKHVKRIIRQRR